MTNYDELASPEMQARLRNWRQNQLAQAAANAAAEAQRVAAVPETAIPTQLPGVYVDAGMLDWYQAAAPFADHRQVNIFIHPPTLKDRPKRQPKEVGKKAVQITAAPVAVPTQTTAEPSRAAELKSGKSRFQPKMVVGSKPRPDTKEIFMIAEPEARSLISARRLVAAAALLLAGFGAYHTLAGHGSNEKSLASRPTAVTPVKPAPSAAPTTPKSVANTPTSTKTNSQGSTAKPSNNSRTVIIRSGAGYWDIIDDLAEQHGIHPTAPQLLHAETKAIHKYGPNIMKDDKGYVMPGHQLGISRAGTAHWHVDAKKFILRDLRHQR